MDSNYNNANIIYEGIIENPGPNEFTITSPDLPEINNYKLGKQSKIKFQVILDPQFKVHNTPVLNNAGELVGSYITIVDKDF